MAHARLGPQWVSPAPRAMSCMWLVFHKMLVRSANEAYRVKVRRKDHAISCVFIKIVAFRLMCLFFNNIVGL